MSGLFGGGSKPAAPVVAEGAEARVARQEETAERNETTQQRRLQAGKRSRRMGGRRLLMSEGVTAGDSGPGRQVLQRVLGVSRNPGGM